MESRKERTLNFARKTGDKLFIEIEITGNPDEVVEKIMDSILNNEELFDGAKCNQILFEGRGVDEIRQMAIRDAVTAMEDSILKIERGLRYPDKENIFTVKCNF